MYSDSTLSKLLFKILLNDAKRQGPGPYVHFRAVSHVTGISGIFRFVLPFLPLRAQFSKELPEILHEVS